MLRLDDHPSGRRFLQMAGPKDVPHRVSRALDPPTMDHLGSEFANQTLDDLDGIKQVFHMRQPVVIFTASERLYVMRNVLWRRNRSRSHGRSAPPRHRRGARFLERGQPTRRAACRTGA
jgi:hypothetical protein